ncbi:MAG: hypothetical protein J0G30_11440 [Actinomycetales bacterium]|nr:hypothetical protein [Actinomycetales bacterium]
MSGPDFMNFEQGIEAEVEGDALKRRLERERDGRDVEVDEDDVAVDSETAAALEAEEEIADERLSGEH